MKKRSLIPISAVFALTALLVMFFILQRLQRKHWPTAQLQNCQTLCMAIHDYQVTHRAYPTTLRDLVATEIIDETSFRKLMFRSSARATPQEWNYKMPVRPDAPCLWSPAPMTPWEGHSGGHILGKSDGSCEIIPADKWPRIAPDAQPITSR